MRRPPRMEERSRRGHRRPFRRGESGVTIVEFALILPIFAVLLFATIDFGMAFGGYLTLRNGFDAAARLAAVDQTDSSCTVPTTAMLCTIKNHVGDAFAGIESGSVQVSFSFPDGGTAAGDRIKVCAKATLRSTSGLTGPFLNGKVISASSTVRLEQGAGTWSQGEGPRTADR